MVKRFKREAQVLAKVGHPNVVGVILGRALYEKAFTLAEAMDVVRA